MTLHALETVDLHAWYGNDHVVRGINIQVPRGHAVTLLGRQGSGRSTLLRALAGLTDARAGSVRINGIESVHLPGEKVNLLGVGYYSDRHAISSELSCEEHLLLPGEQEALGGGLSLIEIYELFPDLYKRRDLPATRLSGGEQQMLAIARLLRTGVTLILLDDICQGMAPVAVQAVGRMIESLKQKGYTIVMVQPSWEFSVMSADSYYIMQDGRIIDQLAPGQLWAQQDSLRTLLQA